MDIKKFLCLILGTIFLAACSADSSGGKNIITDSAGREIVLDEPITKAVALTPSDLEIIYALGAEDILVGRGEYCDYPAEAQELPSVSTGEDTNLEQIIALNPQIVFLSMMQQTEEQIDRLEAAGIKAVVSDSQNIEDVYKAISVTGNVLDKKQEAEDLIQSMKNDFEKIKENVPEGNGKSVYFEVSPLEYGLWTAGENTFMNEIAEMLNLTNTFSDVDGWGEISAEQVIKRNPDYIVTVTMYFGEGPLPEEEIMSREGWQGIEAVKNKKIFPADSDEITRPGPRLTIAAKKLYELIYEE